MPQLYFLRHGETDWNRAGKLQGTQDIPLNDDGRQQARRHASSWSEPLDHLMASPLSRARETAEIWQRHLGLAELELDEKLMERDFGKASGMTVAERDALYPDGQYPEAETFEQLCDRARTFLTTIKNLHPGRKVGIVSHGGFINAVLSVVTNNELGYGKTWLPNVSVCRIDHSEGTWTVAYAGKTQTTTEH